MKNNDFDSSVIEQNRIEKEISEQLKDKIKNINSEETRVMLEAEIKSRNYLPEDWVIPYAVDRIKDILKKSKPEFRNHKISKLDLKTNKKPLIIFLVVAFIIMMFGEIYLNNQTLKSGLNWFITIGFFVFLIYWKCILPKSIKNTSLVITLILSLIITPIAIIIISPIFILFEGVEPPDWTVEIAAILIVGICVGIWRYLYSWLKKPLEKVLRRVGINR